MPDEAIVETGEVTDNLTVEPIIEVDDKGQPIESTEEDTKQESKQEVDVTKLDLTQPEHIKEFRSSYDKRVYELGQAQERISSLEEENDRLRSNSGKGLFFDTNVPLEDFNPDEIRDKMLEEEPEYYERLTESFMQAHFWPNVGEKFQETTTRELNPENPNDVEVLDEMGKAWDVMSRRVAGVDGMMLINILEELGKSQDIKTELILRLRGERKYNPEVPMTFDGNMTAQGSQQFNSQMPQIETVEQVAMRLKLDPSEQSHKAIIDETINNQRKAQAQYYQRMINPETTKSENEKRLEEQVKSLQQTVNSLQNNQKKGGVSEEDATKHAETRLSGLLDNSLKEYIAKEYGNTVPKDKQYLLGKLETLVQTRLSSDPTYQKAKATAVKWFKQSAGAKNATDRDRWDTKGQDALAVMVPIRINAVKAEASELLGTKKLANVSTTKTGTTKTTTRRKEIEQPGKPAPVGMNPATAQPGDISGAKANILKRAQNIPGLLTKTVR